MPKLRAKTDPDVTRRPSPDAPAKPLAWWSGRGMWRAAGIVTAAFAVLLTVPWAPTKSATIGAFDYSLYSALHEAVATGRQFGREIIVPQGPLGFLGTGVYHPRTYPFLVAGRTVIAIIFALALWRAARKLVPNPLVALAGMIAFIALAGRSPDHLFPACGILLLFNYFFVDERRVTPTTYALAAVLAASSLFKVSQPLYAAVVIGTVVLDGIWRRDRWCAALPLVYLVCVGAFYLCARQSPGSAGAFARGWVNILLGHGDAVGLAAPWVDPAAYLVLAACVVALAGVAGWRAWKRPGILAALGTAGVLLLLYKHSFTRQDLWHANMGPMVATAAAVLYLPVIWRAGGSRSRAAGVAVICLGGMLVSSILSSYNGEGLLRYAMIVAGRCGENFSTLVHNVTDRGHLRRDWEADRQAVRAEVPLDVRHVQGTVDVYPHRQDVVFAYDLPYAPRPAISSLMATSPALAELNAAHLRGPSAPQTVLFDVETVDRNFPTMLDGPSLPELLTRYDLIDASGGMLILRRAPQPRTFRLVPLLKQTVRFDEAMALPDPAGAPIWAFVRMKQRPAGKLTSILYKPPVVGIEVHTRGGLETWYRFLPDPAARHGFLLSPLVADRKAFASLASNAWTTQLAPAAVTSIAFFVASGSQETSFEPEIEVELMRLEMSP